MGEVDPAFFQSIEHRPQPISIEAQGIPLIDLSPVKSLDPSTPDSDGILSPLVYEIGEACKNWGFFQVINHGVPFEVRQKIESASRKFFALPKEEKLKVRRDEVNPLGYFDAEHTKNVRDWKEVFDFAAQNPTFMPDLSDSSDRELISFTNRWPEYPPEFRGAFEEYAKEVQKLAFKLLELISLSLGLSADRLKNFFKDQTSFIRLNHYTPCPVPHLALGVGRHKDAGALTILAQDEVAGLEVKRKKDGEWILVKPTPDAYIINVGDIIQAWSNERYESVEHRVRVNNEKERFSIPFFLNPGHYTWVEPLGELIDENNPAKYRAYCWGKFFATKRFSNFKKLDVENIQIHDFKI